MYDQQINVNRTGQQLVTVIIPTYNRPELLQRAIASVRKQQGIRLQIIVVDDASDIDLSELFADDNEVLYLRNETNRGGSYSRNRGLEHAEGFYTNFLDDDDEFLDDKLALQIARFENSGVSNLGMVTCHMRDLRSGHNELVKNTVKGFIYQESLQHYVVKGTPTMLFKTEALWKIGGFDEMLPANQEYDLIIRLSKHYGVDYVDNVLAQANQSSHQISMNFDKKIAGAKHLFNKFDREYREIGRFFRFRMRIKLGMLLCRFWAGKLFGETAYRILLPGKGN